MRNRTDGIGEPIGIITPLTTKVDITLLECEFDRLTNMEEKDIKSHYDVQKILKRYLAIKLILFPFHWTMLRLFVGKNDAKHLSSLHKEFWKVIRTEYVTPEMVVKFMDYTI